MWPIILRTQIRQRITLYSTNLVILVSGEGEKRLALKSVADPSDCPVSGEQHQLPVWQGWAPLILSCSFLQRNIRMLNQCCGSGSGISVTKWHPGPGSVLLLFITDPDPHGTIYKRFKGILFKVQNRTDGTEGRYGNYDGKLCMVFRKRKRWFM